MSQRNDHDIVLIPAAGRVPEGILAFSSISCSAMIPVAGRPVIHWTLSYLHSLGLRRFALAVPRRGLFVEDYVDAVFGRECEISFHVPSADRGLGGTVLELAEAVEGRSALVVLGDTHFELADPAVLDGDDAFVLIERVEDSYRWCIARIDECDRVVELKDKVPDLPGPLEALIGVYRFPELEELRQVARTAMDEAPQEGGTGPRLEMAEILRRLAARRPIHALRAGKWLDCGNPDRQASSHRSLLQMRAFNEIDIDPVLGTLVKRSRKVQKFVDEIDYLRLLPPELAVLFPRVLDFSTDWRDPWLRMEYYGYPTLAEIFVFENVAPGTWERIFHHLAEILERAFGSRRRPASPAATRSMYLDKTRQRLREIEGPPELLALLAAPEVTINGRKVAGLEALWPRIEAAVEALEERPATIIHGDLCLSNVLYDLRSGICKLVDPRGSFGSTGLYGDPRYDVAKLYHSVYGLYDFIVNDLFSVAVDGTEVRLEIRQRPEHDAIRERFERVFFDQPDTFDRREILLITGLLFASMPALHYDAPRRQVAMFCRALELIDECFREEETV